MRITMAMFLSGLARLVLLACLSPTLLCAGEKAWWETAKPEIVRIDKPISADEAKGRCPIALPPEAKNVYYAVYSHVIAYESFVRFEIPYAKGIEFAEEVFKAHARKMGWSFTKPQTLQLSGKPELDFEPRKELKVSWFDIQGIRKGVTIGKLVSWQPQVWIDEERNLFFYCLTD